MLNSDRSGFDPLIPVLHEELPAADILAIDMRGHGKSTNLGSITKFKLAGDYRAMYKDIIGAKEYLKFFRHTPDNYYIVGASIGSSAAIRVPQEESSFQKIVMLSPGMNYKGVDITDDLDFYRKRLLIVTAEGDVQSASDSQTAYSLSQANFKKLVVYEGISAHGTDLFDATESADQVKLTKLIADWLNEG
jgi:pimeloyl-ACP methyl ester carboxylesterase